MVYNTHIYNDLPWIAWCLHPGAKPNLIRDWKYTPTPFGEVVKSALRGRR